MNIIRTYRSILGIPKFRIIAAVLLEIAMIIICECAFAQESSIQDPFKDLPANRGIAGITVAVRDANSSALLGAATPDGPANDSLRIPFPGVYTSALDVIESSDRVPKGSARIPATQEAWLRFRPGEPKPDLSWESGKGKSYIIPALEIPGFLLVLNAFDRLVFRKDKHDGKRDYSSSLHASWDHLIHGPWRYDDDGFQVNQIGHPYQGSLYHGFARSAGLDFWTSLVYASLGSFLWETAGETTNPSLNDQVASGIAGSFFGEALFRMASLVLEDAGGSPGFWRELGAAVISPPTGFNRLIFGHRFKPVLPSRDPAIFHWVRLGEGVIVGNRTGSNLSSRILGSLNYSISYGLPGKPNYSYKRPFDYFQFELTTSSRPNYINIATQGLLLGEKYEVGHSYRGVWGLYGSYEYASPRFFRVSSTAASLGTTAQWWLAPAVALQGTILAGAGLGAGGEPPQKVGDRDYHYGIAGRGLLALRLIFGDLAMFDMSGRGHYISKAAGSKPEGTDIISNFEAGLTFRIYGKHALGIQYVALRRDSHYTGLFESHQRLGTLSLLYTLLGDTRFGAVEWRNGYTH